MLKDENSTCLNIFAFVLFVMVFGCIYAIWTNFIPNEKWIFISKIFAITFAVFYSLLTLLISFEKFNKYKRIGLFVAVFVSCYFVFLYNFSFSLPSIITEFSSQEFNTQYKVLKKRERKLPLFADPDCPYNINVFEYTKYTNMNKVCLSYAEVGRINVNDIISAQGKESWFGKKIEKIN
jgi:hypothetical protein